MRATRVSRTGRRRTATAASSAPSSAAPLRVFGSVAAMMSSDAPVAAASADAEPPAGTGSLAAKASRSSIRVSELNRAIGSRKTGDAAGRRRPRWGGRLLVGIRRRLLLSDEATIAIGVQADRVREHAGRVGWGVDDVVDERSGRRVQPGEMTNALGDLVIGARRVAADAEPADDPPVAIDRDPAPEEDQTTRDLVLVAGLAGPEQEARVEQVRLAEAPQGVAGLREGIEARRRQHEAVEAERVGCVRFRFGDRLASGPHLAGIVGRRGIGADLTGPVDHRRPH